jgi:hypothetical protein
MQGRWPDNFPSQACAKQLDGFIVLQLRNLFLAEVLLTWTQSIVHGNPSQSQAMCWHMLTPEQASKSDHQRWGNQ